MIKFSRLQSIALWFHIPMWVVVSFCIILMGAYHTGQKNAEVRSVKTTTLMSVLPTMSIYQLQSMNVSDI